MTACISGAAGKQLVHIPEHFKLIKSSSAHDKLSWGGGCYMDSFATQMAVVNLKGCDPSVFAKCSSSTHLRSLAAGRADCPGKRSSTMAC
jgi:hypothetical protein